MMQIARTFQRLGTTIEQASKEKHKYDVFLTIVDSVARFHRQGDAKLELFNSYKASHKQAK